MTGLKKAAQTAPLRVLAILGILISPLLSSRSGFAYLQNTAATQTASAGKGKTATLMPPAGLTKLLPATVYFKGQSAPTQARNSGGVHFADDTYMFIALVDASGYSTAVQEKYQAYLITDVSLTFDGRTLPAGAYGCGFRTGDQFVIMDLGGNDLLSATTHHDEAMRRPTPLQVLAGEAPDSFRIYEGRNAVTFSRAPAGSK